MDKIIDSIKSLARGKNLALFVGAGISKEPPSNLPLAGELKSYILEKLSSDEKLKEFYSSVSKKGDIIGEKIRKLPFEIFLQVVKGEHDISKILEIFKRGEPNKNHVLIARLMRKGYIDTVLTTNFDLLIEKALELEGMKRHIDFQVCANELDFSVLFEPDLVPGVLLTLSRLSQRELERYGLTSTIMYKVYTNGSDDTSIRKLLGIKPTIFKVHGSADDVEGIRTTLSEIAGQVFAAKRRLPVEHFFLNGEYTTILILGYSCSDEFDIAPILRQLQSEKTILFVEHDEQKENTFEIKNATKKDNGEYPFNNFNGKKIECDTKNIMDNLWDELIDEKWKCDEKRNENWKNIVDKWSAEISKGSKFAICANVLSHVREYDRAEELCKERIVRCKETADTDGYHLSLSNLCGIYANQGRLDEAIKCYKEVIKSSQESGRPADPDALSNLGVIYFRKGKWRKAVKCHKKAMDISKKASKDVSYATNLRDLAVIYAERGKLNKALELYNECRETLYDYGELSQYADTLFNMGTIYAARADPEGVNQAIVYFKESAEKYKALLDMHTYSRALINLGKAYFQQSKWEDAKKCFDECIQVSERDTRDVSTASEAREWLTKTTTKAQVDLFRKIFHEIRSQQ